MTSDLNSSNQPDRAWHRMQIAAKAVGAEGREFFASSEYTGAEYEAFYQLGDVPEWQPLSTTDHDHWVTWGN
jgi:hypothetical protein